MKIIGLFANGQNKMTIYKMTIYKILLPMLISMNSYANYCNLPDSPVFDTELKAVIYASKKYNPDSIRTDREYIGAVIKDKNNKFRYSVKKGSRGKGSVRANIKIHKICSLSAIWHTHGSKKWGRPQIYFSDVDIKISNDLSVPIYMVSYTNIVRVFNPTDKISGKSRRYLLGKFVSEI